MAEGEQHGSGDDEGESEPVSGGERRERHKNGASAEQAGTKGWKVDLHAAKSEMATEIIHVPR